MSAAATARPVSRGALVFYGVCRFVAVGLSRLYFPGRVVGAEHLPRSGAYVVAPVHRSYVDWLVVARITRRRLRYLVKGEVWKVKAVGRFLELLGAFPVQRDVPDREAFNRALEVLLVGEPLVVFPEGTRQSGPTVGELREGAAYLALRAGVPIVPIGIAGTDRAMPKGARLPRPARVAIVIGAPLGATRDPDAPGRQGRVPRSVTRGLTEELRAGIEGACAEAAGLLGSTDGPAGPAFPGSEEPAPDGGDVPA